MTSPIHHTFAPHVTAAYTGQALLALLNPFTWRTGRDEPALAHELSKRFHGKCSLFLSGRDALLALLRACNFASGSEIIIQGYTCVALPNAIHAAGYTPVYADINPNHLNLDTESLSSKITHRTKAIICQHTFGIPADTKTLRTLADKHQLLLIEDCAHVIPDTDTTDAIGTTGDAVMFSFGRDKAISGISGGAIIVRDETLQEAMTAEDQRKKQSSPFAIASLLFYPLIYTIAKPLYGIGLGKALLWSSKHMGLLPAVLTKKEKHGFQTPTLKRLPNACAKLVRKQLKKLHDINNHRRMLVARYLQAAKKYDWNVPTSVTADQPLQKFPLYTTQSDALRTKLKSYNIYLDDGWTGAAVCPRTVDQEAAGYIAGSCPRAERVEREVLCLPTHPTMTKKQAEKLIKILATLNR